MQSVTKFSLKSISLSKSLAVRCRCSRRHRLRFTPKPFPHFFFFFMCFWTITHAPFPLSSHPHTNLNNHHHENSTQNHSTFSKRWPISTIFTPEKMHTFFIPQSSPLPYRICHPFHTTFVTLFIPPSFYQNFPITCQSANSKISHFSQLSQLSRLSRFSTISTISTKNHPSPMFHPSSKSFSATALEFLIS